MNSRGTSNGRSEYLRNPDGSLRRDQFGRPIRMRPTSGQSAQRPARKPSTPKQVFPESRQPVEETQILRPNSSDRYGSRSYQEAQYPKQQQPEPPFAGQQYPREPYGSQDYPPRQYIPRRPDPSDNYHNDATLYDARRPQDGRISDSRPELRSNGTAPHSSHPEPRSLRSELRSGRPDLHSARPELHSARAERLRRPSLKRGPQRRRPGCLGCGTLLIIPLVLLMVMAVWADARLNRVDALPAEHIDNTAGTNWMLVGSDSRAGLTDAEIEKYGTGGDMGGAGRTDTIMLLHIPTTGQAQLISIPRDSYVSIQGYGMDKINAAYSYGGPELLTQTVENATGLRVDHYAEIGMGGLAKLVDLVDGIEMCPEEPMYDPNANLNIDAGCQTFDGATALGYVRSRASANGDLDRVKHQREFFAALMNTVTSTKTLANPGDILPLISHASGTFTVDSHDHVWDLARVAWAMRSGVATETVPIGGFQDTDVGSVVLWDELAAEELFASIR